MAKLDCIVYYKTFMPLYIFLCLSVVGSLKQIDTHNRMNAALRFITVI